MNVKVILITMFVVFLVVMVPLIYNMVELNNNCVANDGTLVKTVSGLACLPNEIFIN